MEERVRAMHHALGYFSMPYLRSYALTHGINSPMLTERQIYEQVARLLVNQGYSVKIVPEETQLALPYESMDIEDLTQEPQWPAYAEPYPQLRGKGFFE